MLESQLKLEKQFVSDKLKTNHQKFSALGAVYFKEKASYLDQSLESLYKQTLQADEVILIHDGILTDELYSCLKKWLKIFPFKEIKLTENKGLAEALNIGLSKCSYDWVARFDTDDINDCQRFKIQMDYLKLCPETSVLSSVISEFDQIPGDLGNIRATAYSYKDILRYARTRNPMNHPSVIFKKSSVLSVGGYSKDILYMEDYDLWLKMLARGYIFSNITNCLVDHRVGNGMLKRRRGIVYAKSELILYKTKHKLSFKPKIGTLLTRLCSRFLPQVILSMLYRFLRWRDKKAWPGSKGIVSLPFQGQRYPIYDGKRKNDEKNSLFR